MKSMDIIHYNDPELALFLSSLSQNKKHNNPKATQNARLFTQQSKKKKKRAGYKVLPRLALSRVPLLLGYFDIHAAKLVRKTGKGK